MLAGQGAETTAVQNQSCVGQQTCLSTASFDCKLPRENIGSLWFFMVLCHRVGPCLIDAFQHQLVAQLLPVTQWTQWTQWTPWTVQVLTVRGTFEEDVPQMKQPETRGVQDQFADSSLELLPVNCNNMTICSNCIILFTIQL